MSKAVNDIRTASQRAPMITRADELFNEMNRISEQIACRAHELFNSRGRAHGNDLSDWLHAESEYLHPVPIEILEESESLEIRAEVPGFKAQDLRLSVEPRRLILTGSVAQEAREKRGETIYSELNAKHLFRVVELPVEVETGKLNFDLKDGVLHLVLPRKYTSGRADTGAA